MPRVYPQPPASDNGIPAKQWRFLTLLTNDFPRLLPTRLAQCTQGFPRNQSHCADRRFCRCRLSSEGRFCLGSRRITYAVVVDTGPGRRDRLAGASAHRPVARAGYRRGLPVGHGHFQPCARLAAADPLGGTRSCRGPAAATGPAPSVFQCADVRLVPENPAAHVRDRARRHRRRHGVVGRRTVQRPPGLGLAAGLPQGATDRGGASVPRRPHRSPLRNGQRLADRPGHGPAA